MLMALAILAGVWLLYPPAPKRLANSQPAPAETVTGEARATALPPTPAAAANLPPLPPRDAPIQDVLHALQARADAGDGIAACRMSIELMRCQIHARRPAYEISNLQESLPGLREKDDPRAVAAVAAIEAELAGALATEASCARLPEGLVDRAQHYLRAAALAGEPESRFRYASGAGFDDTGDFDYLLTPEFDQWRSDAEAMMQALLADGRPETSLMLAFAYSNDLGLLAGLVPDDPALARAHLALAKRVYGESLAALPIPLPQTEANTSAAEVARADELAAQWHQAHFGGRQYDFLDLLAKESHPWGKALPSGAEDDPCPGPGGERS